MLCAKYDSTINFWEVLPILFFNHDGNANRIKVTRISEFSAFSLTRSVIFNPRI